MWYRLDTDIEIMFRRWARENPRPVNECPTNWHPIIRDEWRRMERERT